MASNEEGEKPILVDFLLKRSKSPLRKNAAYKGRYLVLTPSTLRIHDGTLERGKPEKLKREIRLPNIKALEFVSEKTVDDRKFAMQIVHEDEKGIITQMVVLALYIERQKEWVDKLVKALQSNPTSSYKTKFHSGAWDYQTKSYPCCHNKNDQSEGCHPTVITPKKDDPIYATHQARYQELTELCDSEEHPYDDVDHSDVCSSRDSQGKPNLPPKPTPRKKGRKVVAKRDCPADSDNFLNVLAGETYTITDDSNMDWWLAVGPDGKEGFVTKEIDKEPNLDADMDSSYLTMERTEPEQPVSETWQTNKWYHAQVSREESEDMLYKEAHVGCFLVRPSSQPKRYVLSLYYELQTEKRGFFSRKRGQGLVKHYLIHQYEKGPYCIFNDHSKDSLPELIRFHKHNSAGLVARLNRCPDAAKSYHEVPVAEQEINIKDLKPVDTIGSGHFGIVQKARLRGKLDVAVTTLTPDMVMLEGFKAETKLILAFQHPRVTRLYGTIPSDNNLLLVTEYMEHGSLSNYLKQKEEEILKNTYKAYTICRQICGAMTYLESKAFFHGDLTAGNCQVGSNEIVKVGDIGLARYRLNVAPYRTQFSPEWASPEVLNNCTFSTKADVWSFGVVMWEVYTAAKETPYGKNLSLDEIQRCVCEQKNRLHKPEPCDDVVYVIMCKCWEDEADQRPDFKDLWQDLSNLDEAMGGYEELPSEKKYKASISE